MSDRAKFYSKVAVTLVTAHCIAAVFALAVLIFGGCARMKPQQGGKSTVTLGGSAPSSVNLTAPENPKTPTKQSLKKTTTREWTPVRAVGQWPVGQFAPSEAPAFEPFRESIFEESTTELGSSWEDKARELVARLGNMRGVMWAGVALLVCGPIIGWKMGWLLNGLIAGAVGLLLIILSTVIPGNEAWFGLGGLLVIPLIAYVYYRAQYDANKDGIPDRKQRGAPAPTPTPST